MSAAPIVHHQARGTGAGIPAEVDVCIHGRVLGMTEQMTCPRCAEPYGFHSDSCGMIDPRLALWAPVLRVVLDDSIVYRFCDPAGREHDIVYYLNRRGLGGVGVLPEPTWREWADRHWACEVVLGMPS